MCVLRSLMFHLETKMHAVTPNPLTEEESRRVYNCDKERLSGSTNRLIFESVWNM